MANLDTKKLQPIPVGDDGNIYIEKFDERQSNWVNVCDSVGKPFFRINVDNLFVRRGEKTPIQVYQAEYDYLAKFDSVEKFARAFTAGAASEDYQIVDDWTDFIEWKYKDKAYITEKGQWIDTRDGSEIFESDMLKQSGVFKIGDKYLWISDFDDLKLV